MNKKIAICDGYEESGSPDTNCTSTQICVEGAGGELYCAKHANMAGSVIASFNPPIEIELDDED